jgi:hypothetical protein
MMAVMVETMAAAVIATIMTMKRSGVPYGVTNSNGYGCGHGNGRQRQMQLQSTAMVNAYMAIMMATAGQQQ